MVKKPRVIPNDPGVYIFRRGDTPIYVGKAAVLKNRVSSYFKKNPGWKVEELRREATRLEFIKTPSEIEALIKESELIKKYTPKFNVLMRDDKSYTYIGVTSGQFPRFFFSHQPFLIQNAKIKNQNYSAKFKSNPDKYIGPFVERGLLKDTLRLLRDIFPYCTCKKPHAGKCVNAQIGRCPGYCCQKDRETTSNEINEYQKNIRSIVSILTGKRNSILKNLKSEMRKASKEQQYENAAKLRDQIYGLESLAEHRGIARHQRAETPYHKIDRVLQSIFGAKEPVRRIEGYDIANISGADSTASMVVFYDGKPDKSQYRKFKIKTVIGPNDVASQREVLRRRLAHSEWEYPDLVLIDGGKPQLNAVLPLLNTKQFRKIKLAALSKPPKKFFSRAPSGPGQNEDMLYISGRSLPLAVKTFPPPVMHFLQRIRDESHRFARVYHNLLRKQSILG